ncbi:uncharacterized protein LOC131034636 isoform X1 [Cryptomeria japonica]|uniref:uncharacterized protein LOC131034636 isoform X1 n=1 Tax=Cryptomeria japonica TaxID=3369 RepID=UPI0027DA7950|nr:uncharacterized protein LOC131034636 isoform X1 [Cryptomeria japonica]
MNASNVCDGRSANFAEKKENSGTGNADKTSNTAENSCSLGMVTRAAGGGFIIGAAAGLTLELHSGFLTSWKAFPNSMVRGAVAFGSALGIYEATKCKLLQTRVMDDLSSSSIAGSLGTGVGGTLFGAFPWTRPNSMKMYQERFQEFRKEIPKNFVKYAAIGGVYFALESIVISKYFPDKQDPPEQQLSFPPSKGI